MKEKDNNNKVSEGRGHDNDKVDEGEERGRYREKL